MEHNKQLYEHLFQAIRKQLESGLARTEGNDAFNIFKVLGIADKEVLICRLLGELLDPKGSHGLGAKPLSLFLEQLRIADRFSPDQIAKAHVVLEETIDRDRRIDLVLYLGNEVIPLEVKVWAGDQNKQLYDYYHYFAQARQRNGTFKIYDRKAASWQVVMPRLSSKTKVHIRIKPTLVERQSEGHLWWS